MHTLNRVYAGSVNVSTKLKVIDAGTGVPDQALTYTDFALWYHRDVPDGETPEALQGGPFTEVALAGLTTAHTDYGILHIEEGIYRVDMPDACWAVGAVGVTIGAVITDKIVISAYHEIIPKDGRIFGTVGSTSLSTTGCSSDLTAYAADELINRSIIFTNGTAAGQGAVITDYVVSNGVISFSAGVATAPVNGDLFVIV